MSLVHFTENYDLTTFKFDPRTLLSTSYDMIYEAMVQNDEFRKGHWLGKFLFEKFNTDVEAHDTSKSLSRDKANPHVLADTVKATEETIDSIQAMNQTKHLLLLQTHNYARALQSHDREKRKDSLKELKALLTPFFSEHLKPEQASPKKKMGFFSLFKN